MGESGRTCTRGADHMLSLVDQLPAGERLYECFAPGCDTQVIEDTDGIRHLLTGTRSSSR